ncbi:MAG: hypothetical protein NNA20_04810 [Nitrospira sp.]|nr:hypothetical protein [Nitrospira sp.]MCP9441893.1 hypothetical protein [Nitrospira sp.]
MVHPAFMVLGIRLACFVIALLAVGIGWPHAIAGSLGSARPSIVGHDIEVRINPATHELIGRDRMVVAMPIEAKTVSFSLAPTVQVESLVMIDKDESQDGRERTHPLTFSIDRTDRRAGRRVVVTLPSGHAGQVTLAWTYRGAINNPPKEPRHLRFVTPSDTAGHIGNEGVYLSGESQWYPDIDGSYSTYRLQAQLPEGWTVVTQGLRQASTVQDGWDSSTWIVSDPSEALTLVANRFVVRSREWTSRTGQRITLETYFFQDNAGLADEYLDATATYLDAYIGILGEYPFHRFAVVENFFPSGLGMPSFTLLGSGSIKRHYVQPYALGHEIVHSWIGNAVFNRQGAGNWVEGLTTYLANYYWHELSGDAQQATEQRRLMVEGYSLYVEPDQDYPISRFFTKEDEKDNAIGYHKAALVFHHLRHEIGEETFWRGIKTFVQRHRNRPADWSDIEAVFAQESGQDLRWFFEQWVERSGAPQLSLDDVRAFLVRSDDGRETWRVVIQIGQSGRLFQMAVPLRIVLSDGAETKWIRVGPASTTTDEVVVAGRPLQVHLDPDWMAFRRIARDRLTPMLNGYVTDGRRTVVRTVMGAAGPFQPVIDRIVQREAQWPESRKTSMASIRETVLPPGGSALVLAGADQQNRIGPLVQESCGDLVRFHEKGFDVKGRTYEGPQMAVLFTCRRAAVPGSVVTVLYGMSEEAVERISHYLFYYGWHSYVVFKNGTVVERGLWQEEPEAKEVEVHGAR